MNGRAPPEVFKAGSPRVLTDLMDPPGTAGVRRIDDQYRVQLVEFTRKFRIADAAPCLGEANIATLRRAGLVETRRGVREAETGSSGSG